MDFGKLVSLTANKTAYEAFRISKYLPVVLSMRKNRVHIKNPDSEKIPVYVK